MEEKMKDELINDAINKLSELTGEDFHGYRSEIWNVLSSLLSSKDKEGKKTDKEIMDQWDRWRKYISSGGTASWPRDEFENLIACYEEDIRELGAKIKKLEEKFPCGHRRLDWDDSYGNCVVCSLKEDADKYDDQLGFELNVKALEEGIEELITYGMPKHIEEGLHKLLPKKE